MFSSPRSTRTTEMPSMLDSVGSDFLCSQRDAELRLTDLREKIGDAILDDLANSGEDQGPRKR